MTRPPDPGPMLPAVARRAIAAYLAGDGFGDAAGGGAPAPVFVTLREPGGALRGCVGVLVPTQPDLLRETARSAVMAATRDPRFSPVTTVELTGLTIEVCVLQPLEPVDGIDALDPAIFGVMVRSGAGHTGMILPGIPGLLDARAQVELALDKAGIPRGSAIELSRFRVHRWTGK